MPRRRKAKTMKYFVLRKGTKDTAHVFTGKQPRQAALKAATRGFTDIKLRERGTDKVHIFKGMRKQVAAPRNRPDWMPARIWKSNVRKLGIEHLKAKKKKAAKPKRKAKRKVARKRKPVRRKRRRR